MALFRSTASTAPASVAATTVTMPAGWAAGDLVLVYAGGKYDTTTLTISSGWTQIGTKATLVTGPVQVSDSGRTVGYLWGRIMQAGDSAPTVTPSGANSFEIIAECWQLQAGESWTDAADLTQVPFIKDESDTSPTAPVTGSGTFLTQPDAASGGSAITAFATLPTDAGTGQGTSSVSNSGAVGGTVTNRMYAENTLGAQSAGLSWTFTGWTGTFSGATTVSSQVSGATNNYGVVVAAWLRTSASGSATYNATASLTGTGSITAGAAADRPAAASLAGTGTITAGAAADRPTTASLTGTGTISAGAVTILGGSAASTATASITAAASRQPGIPAALTAAATIAAGAAVTRAVTATLIATATTTATATAAAAVYLFRTPTENSVPTFGPNALPHQRALMRHMPPYPRGVAVLITNGVATQHHLVTTAMIEAADYAYLGGYTYQITDPIEKAIIEAAGYTLESA